MTFEISLLTLQKLYPLAISRGVTSSSQNLFLKLTDASGNIGLGECSTSTSDQDAAARADKQLTQFLTDHDIEGMAIHDVDALARTEGMDAPAIAALDTALWDQFARKAAQPLFRVFGLPNRSVPTSVTIGINPPEVTRERVPDILRRTGAKYLKIKLGSPEGVEADKGHFLAAKDSSAAFNVGLRVDANGGWSLTDAKAMIKWLATQDVAYVEQPLPQGSEDQLPELFAGRALPIFVDESCRTSLDAPKIADRADGINLKLMKTGGLTEALRLVATARAHGLQTMIGCMSESSVGIGAGAAIGALFDHIDLDSHLNLNPDPGRGLGLVDGVVTPSESPGHGVSL